MASRLGSRLIQFILLLFISLAWECVIVLLLFIRISTLSENGLLEKMKICGEEPGANGISISLRVPGDVFHKWLENGSDIRRGSIIAFAGVASWRCFVTGLMKWLFLPRKQFFSGIFQPRAFWEKLLSKIFSRV